MFYEDECKDACGRHELALKKLRIIAIIRSAFLRQYCGADADGLVTIDGVIYRIVGIGMRMLQPAELYRAQGFPEWYIIDHDFWGVKYAKDKQVARCGNAVQPRFAEAMVRANLPELCEATEMAA